MADKPPRFACAGVSGLNAIELASASIGFIEDIELPEDALHLVVIGADCAAGTVKSLGLKALTKHADTELVLSAKDIPGENNASLVADDEPVFAARDIHYHGQPLCAVAAKSIHLAKLVAARADMQITSRVPVLTIEQAMNAKSRLEPDVVLKRGRPGSAIKNAGHRLTGQFYIGGQEHFYPERQISVAIPGNNGTIRVHCSTEHPEGVRAVIARALAIPIDAVQVSAPVLGGSFGGKQTQAAQWAVIAALAAYKTQRPASLRLDRDDDLAMTGKRHDFLVDYRAGFDDEGVIKGIEFTLSSNCGYSADLSTQVNDNALFHIDNCYYLKNINLVSRRFRTNTASGTAFRGFGAAQAVLAIERVMDGIANKSGLDPLLVRNRNLYGTKTGNISHYGMKLTDGIADRIIETLKRSATYPKRRKSVFEFNQSSPIVKRGISLVPVKCGVPLSGLASSQATVSVRITDDSRVEIELGGAESGQGLYTKLAQVAAEIFQIPPDRILCITRAGGVNPDPLTACGTADVDVYGMAVKVAAEQIRDRLARFAQGQYKLAASRVCFSPEGVRMGKKNVRFKTLVSQAVKASIALSAEGFYAIPKFRYNAKTRKGRPYYYFTYGAAVTEVALDTLTGESRVLRVDILQDCGRSLNPVIDKGQIEGGFIQGMGWLTCEELIRDDLGALQTSGTQAYKIPTCTDVPEQFNVRIWTQGKNSEPTVYHSKSVSDAPVLLAASVYSALSQAVAAAREDNTIPRLDTPLTPQCLLRAIHEK